MDIFDIVLGTYSTHAFRNAIINKGNACTVRRRKNKLNIERNPKIYDFLTDILSPISFVKKKFLRN